MNPDRRAAVATVPAEMREGWLIFESAGERRRLAPIPPGWERYTDEGLERLCQRASTRHTD